MEEGGGGGRRRGRGGGGGGWGRREREEKEKREGSNALCPRIMVSSPVQTYTCLPPLLPTPSCICE